jgi:hypothetical protein
MSGKTAICGTDHSQRSLCCGVDATADGQLNVRQLLCAKVGVPQQPEPPMPRKPARKSAAPKVLLVGASGTLGRAVHAELVQGHDVLAASRSGKLKVDITDSVSIRRLFKKTGKVDAIVCAAGKVHFGALAEMTEELYAIGLRDKLMGQINLALIGRDYLNDGGSITLIAGILAEQPIRLAVPQAWSMALSRHLCARRQSSCRAVCESMR